MPFTAEALTAYLATQTNVAAAIRQGAESLASATGWLLAQVRPATMWRERLEKGLLAFEDLNCGELLPE